MPENPENIVKTYTQNCTLSAFDGFFLLLLFLQISGAIDVDRLVQERDVVSLQENLISIINYNLDSEYDVKILDPNFVKLFKLAQLSIDYLLYSEQHFYNCTELEQRQMKKYVKVFTILCFLKHFCMYYKK